jgi:quercetin dioxygenase-like cupin family protein
MTQLNLITKGYNVHDLHKVMATMPQDNTCRVEHTFCNGMYQRKFFINKGVLAMSRVHKKDYLFVIAKGKVKISDTEINPDSKSNVYEAGDCFVARAGAKRSVYALEDSIIISVHRTDKHNLEKIEKELVEFNPLDLFDVNDQPKRGVIVCEQKELIE